MSGSDLAESAGPTVAEILAKLGTDSKTGLNSDELQERLSKYGPNALPEERKSALSGVLAYFWGPIPWMIEAAALMAATFELSCATLLALGLATRAATLPLLGMIAVIQTFVYPHAWSDHLTWGSMLIFLLTRGGGPLSLDRLVGLEPAQTHKA